MFILYFLKFCSYFWTRNFSLSTLKKNSLWQGLQINYISRQIIQQFSFSDVCFNLRYIFSILIIKWYYLSYYLIYSNLIYTYIPFWFEVCKWPIYFRSFRIEKKSCFCCVPYSDNRIFSLCIQNVIYFVTSVI